MRFSFKKGLSFLRGERRFTIVRRLMDSSLQLEGEDGEIINCLESEILLGCSQGSWLVDTTDLNPRLSIEPRVTRDLNTFSHKAQQKARMRQQYLDKLTDNGKLVCNMPVLAQLIKAIAVEINDTDPPSAITLYRWHMRQKKAGNRPREHAFYRSF
jgi:putative transposase